MRWWGWGEDEDAAPLSARAEAMVGSLLGAEPTAPPAERGGPESVQLPASELPAAARTALVSAVGAEHVLDDHATRLGRAAGRSYPDLVRLRSGRLDQAPDAVVRPADGDQVAAVIAACAQAGVAVVPFGGGTSVVGGVDAVRGPHAAAIALDLGRMDRVLDVDPVSLTARVEAGLLGPELERRLAATGLTLGHYPQSFEYSTVGGWVATRSAGQASTGIGRIDELVQAVSCQTPAGVLDTRDVPASGAGPSLRELVVGSEGVLGVITAATLRVREAPSARRYEAWSVGTFAQGVDAMRRLEQAGAHPDVCRLSDEAETGLTVAMGSSGGRAEQLGRTYLRLRGQEDGCLLIAGFEGGRDDVARRRGRFAEMLRAAGGVFLGERFGRAWRARALRRALPARRAAGPRRHGRDAGDRLPVVTPRRHPRGRRRSHRGRPGRARHPGDRDVPRLAPLSLGSLAVLHVHRPAGARRRAGSVAGRQDRRRGRDRRRRCRHHPPPRRGPRPQPVDGGRGGPAGPGGPQRAEGAAGPHGHHEPRESCCRSRRS